MPVTDERSRAVVRGVEEAVSGEPDVDPEAVLIENVYALVDEISKSLDENPSEQTLVRESKEITHADDFQEDVVVVSHQEFDEFALSAFPEDDFQRLMDASFNLADWGLDSQGQEGV